MTFCFKHLDHFLTCKDFLDEDQIEEAFDDFICFFEWRILSVTVQEFFQKYEENFIVMLRPQDYPDFNLIEHLWHVLDQEETFTS